MKAGLINKRFFISWILSSIFMFGLSYLWHGLLLNDLIDLAYPLGFFLGLCGVVYSVIGFILAFLFHYLHIEEQQIWKGLSLGGALGFFIYLIAFTLGVSFKSHGVEHVVVDFIWQMIEQGIGGSLVGFVFLMDKRRAQIMGEE